MSPALARYLALPALVLIGSCGADGQSTAKNRAAGSPTNPGPAELQLASDAFVNGGPIATQYSCDGGNRIPAARWGDPPKATRSLALVIVDPDAPTGTFGHWGVFDIPASARSISEDQRLGIEVRNDFAKPGYGGPCPPRGRGPHHYHLKLFALDVEHLPLTATSKVSDVENEAHRHAIAQGELIGTYERR